MTNLDEFIQKNSIGSEQLLEALYNDIQETLLRITCQKMKKNPDFKQRVKKIYFATADDNKATQRVIMEACGCNLPEEDIEWMTMCIKAFLTKTDNRATIPKEVKEKLLEDQGSKCVLCCSPIDLHTMRVDHIIPWDYVGDKLPNNYQGLCSDCNLSKSNHVARAVTNIITKGGFKK